MLWALLGSFADLLSPIEDVPAMFGLMGGSPLFLLAGHELKTHTFALLVMFHLLEIARSHARRLRGKDSLFLFDFWLFFFSPLTLDRIGFFKQLILHTTRRPLCYRIPGQVGMGIPRCVWPTIHRSRPPNSQLALLMNTPSSSSFCWRSSGRWFSLSLVDRGGVQKSY